MPKRRQVIIWINADSIHWRIYAVDELNKDADPIITLIARFMGPTWAHPGPIGPTWASCWLHGPCYLGSPLSGFFVIGYFIVIGSARRPDPTHRYIVIRMQHFSCQLVLSFWWVGVVFISKVMAIFSRVGGYFSLFQYHCRGCLNKPIF